MKKKFTVLGIFALLFAVLSVCVYHNSALSNNEVLIIQAIQSIMKGVPTSLAKFLSSLGHEQNWNYVVIFATLVLIICRKFKAGILFWLAIFSANKIYSFIKTIIMRPRPPVEIRLIDIDGYSFPSGHSTMSMVTYGFLIYLVCKYVKNKILKTVLVALLSLLILLIGFSRNWLGVHFPTDVLGGFSLGICIICIFAIINEIKFTK